MSNAVSFLKTFKEHIKYRLRWRHQWRTWFLERHACLGYEVLKYYDGLPKRVNFQKGRADLLSEYWFDKALLPKSSRLKTFMTRFDLLELIRQLEFFSCLPSTAPKFIFMDSFSELTDQMFMSRSEGWRFCCGYSDVRHDEYFSRDYLCEGLIPVEKLKDAYLKLFSIFKTRWGAVPIYFLHFPIALETREVFQGRYREITLAIDEIARDHPHIYSIKIDESKVQRSKDASDELREFPYHYDEATYLLFKKAIEEVAPLSW
jgi:hypothetical protein